MQKDLGPNWSLTLVIFLYMLSSTITLLIPLDVCKTSNMHRKSVRILKPSIKEARHTAQELDIHQEGRVYFLASSID